MALLNRKNNRYMELVAEFPLKLIHSDKQLERARAMLNALLDIEELNGDGRDYLEVLGSIIHEYESRHYPIEDVEEGDVLAHLIEAKGTTQRAVAEATGIPESTISDLLSGRRELNRNHIGRLAAHFNISPAVFFSTKQPA